MTALSKREIEVLQEKERLSEFPYFEMDPDRPDVGVLLSDRIEYYCGNNFKLIWPFKKEYLRPAGYDLRVGDNYTLKGEAHTLNLGGSFTIEPYQVAIIQTLETLNVPHFLIGRWNIRVGLAYEGLLWVGGAQVDPGFRGRLSCPIYNLSTTPVKLDHGGKLAMIDFVTTTPAGPLSQPFQWWSSDKKHVFQQYKLGLQSGVADRLEKMDGKLAENKKATDKELGDASDRTLKMIEEIRARIDYFVTLVFTVVAVLFAGLGVVATKGSDSPSLVSSPVWAAVALYFALRSYITANELAKSGQAPAVDRWYTPILRRPIEFAIATAVVLGSLGFDIWDAHLSVQQVRHATEEASKAVSATQQEGASIQEEIQLRRQSDARIENLQQQVNLLLQRMPASSERLQQTEAKKK